MKLLFYPLYYWLKVIKKGIQISNSSGNELSAGDICFAEGLHFDTNDIMIKKSLFFHNLEVEVTHGQYILIGRAYLTFY